MSEMVDRVAKAINPVDWQAEETILAARRAIEAMREPTMAMCVAYEQAMKRYIDKLPPSIRHSKNYYPRGYMVQEALKLKIRYRAMIDAALR